MNISDHMWKNIILLIIILLVLYIGSLQIDNVSQEGFDPTPYPKSEYGYVVVGSQSGGDWFFANSNITGAPNWTQLGKNVTNVSYSNGKLFFISNNNLYYSSNYKNASFVQIPAKITQVSYDGYNDVLMVIGMASDIFYANKNIYSAPNWTRVGGWCKYVSYSNQRAYAIGTNDEIYYTPSYTSGNWVRMPGSLKQVSFDGYKNVVVGVNSADDIWYANQNVDNTSIRWRQIPGKLRYVSYSDEQIYGTNSASDIYYTRIYHDGDRIQQTWKHIPGKLNCVSFDGVDLVESKKELSAQVVEGVSHVQVLGGNDWLQISQLVVIDEYGNNIAPSGKATSSGSYVRWRPSEHYAIDGIQQPRRYPNVYHSSSPRNAWFSVQLPHVTNVTSVVVYNRTDCCNMRLASGYRVRLLDSNKKVLFESAKLNGNDKQVVDLPTRKMRSVMAPIPAIVAPYVPPVPVNRIAPAPVNLPVVPPPVVTPPPPPPLAKPVHTLSGKGTGIGVSYVKVNTAGEGDHWLQISQIAVMDMQGNNVALSAVATSSGTGWGTTEMKSIDGKMEARAYPNIHHSNTPNKAWYMLKLQNVTNVGSVIIYNRTDCCSSRMIGTTVTLLDTKQNILFKSDPLIDAAEQMIKVPQIIPIKVEPEKTYTNSVRGCDNQNLNLKCPRGQIITNSIVNYGKWDDDSCGTAPVEPIMKTKQLSSVFNADILNRNHAQLNINRISFKEDPAPFLNKSVEIKYDCAPPSSVPHAYRNMKSAEYHYLPPPSK